MLKLGDRVQVLARSSCYVSDESQHEEYPVDTVGYVVYIRSRYENTPNYYCQYKVARDNIITDRNDLRHLYLDYQLKPA